MGYSKIKDFTLVNFMCFKYAKVSFDDTNILNIKGYNDSGKSAILRGIMVCLDDMFKRVQSKYIRYGSNFFRIIVTFEDGVSILREKYATGQSLYEMYKDGKLVYTSKQGNRPTRIEAVPAMIQEYLGLCVTDNGCINYQSCNDKLFLGDTSGSENYQELHTVLKSEEISRATTLINSDRNELNQRVIEIENEYRESNAVLKSKVYVDKSFIKDMEVRDKLLDFYEGKIDDLIALSQDYNNLEEIKDIPKVNTLDEKRIKALDSLLADSNELSGMEEIPEVPYVGSSRLVHISGVLSDYQEAVRSVDIPEVRYVDTRREKDLLEIKGYFDTLQDMEEVPEIPTMNTSRLGSLIEMREMAEQCNLVVELPDLSGVAIGGSDRMGMLDGILRDVREIVNCVELENSLTERVRDTQSVLSDLVESSGEKFVTCPNCGTYIPVSQ